MEGRAIKAQKLKKPAFVDPFAPGCSFGPYVIERRLGKGAMGLVLLAEKPGEGRFALKILPPQLNDKNSARTRFKREIEAIARLSHPNIIHFYDYGVVGGVYYYAMEYIEGRDLGRILPEGRLGYRRAATIAAKCARGLELAHSRKIIHRDIKPSNILIDTHGEPYLSDFGLVRLRDQESSLTREGFILGTPIYMSPEQIRGRQNCNHRTDIYSLGATLFYLATGRTPYEGTDFRQIIVELFTALPPDARKVDEHLPDELAVIITKAMKRRPEQRYQSMAAFARDLEAFIAGPYSSVPCEPGKEAWRKRGPLTLALLVGLGLATLTLGARPPTERPVRASQVASPPASMPVDVALVEEPPLLDLERLIEGPRPITYAHKKQARVLIVEIRQRASKQPEVREDPAEVALQPLGDDPTIITARLLNHAIDEETRGRNLLARARAFLKRDDPIYEGLAENDLSEVEGGSRWRARLDLVEFRIRRCRFEEALSALEALLTDLESRRVRAEKLFSREEIARSYLLKARLLMKLDKPKSEVAAAAARARVFEPEASGKAIIQAWLSWLDSQQ